MKINLFCKIIPCIALFKLFSNDLTAQTESNDTIKLFANKRIINWKGKDWEFNGCNYKLVNNDDGYFLTLQDVNSDNLIEIFIVIDKKSEELAKFYIVIDGKKHLVKLSSFFSYVSRGKNFVLYPNGSYEEKTMHCDHYSHYSHMSSIPKK